MNEPTTLGPYELRGELGRGAMAIVWRGYDMRLDREVAIKEPVLPPGIDDATREEFGSRFIREGRAAAGLNHPGIVTIYTADTYDDRPVIVMELIEGETLSSVLDRGALPPTAALAAADQLLDALGYAHSRGIVHRDVKPDNVFVTVDGRVKLTDFGIAHVGATNTLTQAGTVMGTPGYMAPEQVMGQPADGRADLFAVGALLHEMLTGSNPFGATDGLVPTTVMYRIVHEEADPLPVPVLQQVPEWVEPVIRCALGKEPASRFPTAEVMRAALNGRTVDMQASMSTLNMAPLQSVAAQGSQRPTWVPYAVVGAIGLLVVVGLLITSRPGGGSVAGTTVAAATTSAAEVVPTAEPAAPAAEPVQPVTPPVDYEAEVADMVESWRIAWESEDLGRYMNYYAADFYSNYKKMNRAQWETYKRDLFRKYSFQRVSITTPDINVSDDTATARFAQDFQSDSYGDYGTKTLTLRLDGGVWLITGEEWHK